MPTARRFAAPSRILLVEPPNSLSVGFNATVVVEPLGLEYIAGAIADIAEVRIFDMRVDPTPLSQVIAEYRPGVVGVREGYTVDVDSVRRVAAQVKDIDPDIPVVVGGHHVSLSPQDAYTNDVDAIVVGDGEQRFRDLVLSLQRSNRLDTTDQVIFRDTEGQFSRANALPLARSSFTEFDSALLNGRPLPARHLVEQYRKSYFFLYHESPYSFESARGCIYRCNFCSVHEFHRGEYRVQGNERTLMELEGLPRNSWVNVVDDLAIQELPAAIRQRYPEGYDPNEELADRIAEMGLGHRYWMQVRADNVVRNPRKFEKWARAGLDTCLVGLESFEQDDLNSVSKGTKSLDNERAIEILHEFGVRVWGGVIIFQEWAERNFENLKRKVQEYQIEFPNYTILTPLPGTGQWKQKADELITKEPRFFDFLHSVVNTRLSGSEFYAQYASLWRTVGTGGMERVRNMLNEVSATRESVTRFMKQYRTLGDVDTYSQGIELLERAGRGPTTRTHTVSVPA